jgi:hypothetical protein
VRAYVAVNVVQLHQLLKEAISVAEYLTPAQFEFDAQVDEEEREHLVSLLAAEDSLETNGGGVGLVLAVDLEDSQLNAAELEISLKQVAALLHTDDGQTLSWFAPEEIQFQLGEWTK